jgi:hypothetical protein
MDLNMTKENDSRLAAAEAACKRITEALAAHVRDNSSTWKKCSQFTNSSNTWREAISKSMSSSTCEQQQQESGCMNHTQYQESGDVIPIGGAMTLATIAGWCLP